MFGMCYYIQSVKAEAAKEKALQELAREREELNFLRSLDWTDEQMERYQERLRQIK